MEASLFETYLARLSKRREQLLTTLRHLDDQQQEVDDNTDWVDQAAYESRIASLDGLRRDFRAELTRIEGALERIDNFMYGSCAACHDPIDPKRLELVPEAEYCCGCERFREDLELNAA